MVLKGFLLYAPYFYPVNLLILITNHCLINFLWIHTLFYGKPIDITNGLLTMPYVTIRLYQHDVDRIHPNARKHGMDRNKYLTELLTAALRQEQPVLAPKTRVVVRYERPVVPPLCPNCGVGIEPIGYVKRVKTD